MPLSTKLTRLASAPLPLTRLPIRTLLTRMKRFPRISRPALLGLACLILTGQALAQNLLTNPSFDLGSFTDRGDGFQILSNGSTTITGWTVINDSLAWGKYPNSAPNVHPAIPRDGTFFLDLQGDGLQGTPFGGVSQSIATIAGRKYVLRFHLGTQQDAGSPATHGPISVNASAGTTTAPFTFNPVGTTGSQWQEFKLVFVAQGASTLISITGQSTAGGAYIGLDHTSVVEVLDPTLTIAPMTGLAKLTLTGSVGSTYRIEWSHDMSALSWSPLVDLTLATASQEHTDPASPVSIGRRFYRASLLSE
jgi:hypothetical protein